jgi:hypothetical protein
MPHAKPPLAGQFDEHGRFNRFLATLPSHDFSLLAPHLRTVPLERGTILHDVGEEIEHVYFPHSGMVSRWRPCQAETPWRRQRSGVQG